MLWGLNFGSQTAIVLNMEKKREEQWQLRGEGNDAVDWMMTHRVFSPHKPRSNYFWATQTRLTWSNVIKNVQWNKTWKDCIVYTCVGFVDSHSNMQQSTGNKAIQITATHTVLTATEMYRSSFVRNYLTITQPRHPAVPYFTHHKTNIYKYNKGNKYSKYLLGWWLIHNGG